MGIDKSLSDDYPSVIIGTTKYQYGREKEHGQYLVENSHIAKDYWVFDEKQDLQAFLTNLPESADRDLRLRLHPDWREVTPEQRDAYMEEDKLKFRAMAEEKVKSGKAMTFDMDLEGVNGPHTPQRLPDNGGESPLQKAENQLRQHKASGMLGGRLSEAGKLRVIEGEVEWVGVKPDSKEAILKREVKFSKIDRNAFEFVYQDIRFDKGWKADDTVARKLFEAAHRPKVNNGPSFDRSAEFADPEYQRAVDEAAQRHGRSDYEKSLKEAADKGSNHTQNKGPQR